MIQTLHVRYLWYAHIEYPIVPTKHTYTHTYLHASSCPRHVLPIGRWQVRHGQVEQASTIWKGIRYHHCCQWLFGSALDDSNHVKPQVTYIHFHSPSTYHNPHCYSSKNHMPPWSIHDFDVLGEREWPYPPHHLHVHAFDCRLKTYAIRHIMLIHPSLPRHTVIDACITKHT